MDLTELNAWRDAWSDSLPDRAIVELDRDVIPALEKQRVDVERDAVLEEAAQVCDKAARFYRAMKTDEHGQPEDDAEQAEEMAYCSELSAKDIRELKSTQSNSPR